jgi:hypothetical protein
MLNIHLGFLFLIHMNLRKKRSGEMTMGQLFLVFLLIVFALALTPTIGDSVFAATNATNITGAAADILELVPLVWVFIVVGIGAAAVVKMFEDIG